MKIDGLKCSGNRSRIGETATRVAGPHDRVAGRPRCCDKAPTGRTMLTTLARRAARLSRSSRKAGAKPAFPSPYKCGLQLAEVKNTSCRRTNQPAISAADVMPIRHNVMRTMHWICCTAFAYDRVQPVAFSFPKRHAGPVVSLTYLLRVSEWCVCAPLFFSGGSLDIRLHFLQDRVSL